MAIKSSDIVLFQSQDNTDNDNGGGRRTNNKVVDGAVNNLFPDISRIDSVSGDFAMRKVFPVVNTDNRDIYYGAHTMIRKTPDDPKVSSLIFYTDDAKDIRKQAQEKIEGYVTASNKAPFYLFGNTIKGSKAVTFLQQRAETMPSIGEVYLLKQGTTEEYFRIAEIQDKMVPFNLAGRNYYMRRLIVTTEQPIANNFTGSLFTPEGQQPNTTDTFATQIADAAKFFGTRHLSTAANKDDSTIQVDSIFEQLVPSSTKQTPIVNEPVFPDAEILVPMPVDQALQMGIYVLNKNDSVIQMPSAIKPGTFKISNYTDDEKGNLMDGETVVGTIDYKSGVISYTGTSTNSSNYYGYYEPAASIQDKLKYSKGVYVTSSTQKIVYIETVSPVPTAPDCYVDYRANDRWYRIPANYDGTLGNDPSVGAGLISDNGDGTATISVTLGAMPDLESTVIFSWGSKDGFYEGVEEAKAKTENNYIIELGNTNVDPATVDITYNNDGNSTRNLTFDAQGDLISPNSKGVNAKVDAVNGIVSITNLPSFGSSEETPRYDSDITVKYNYAGAIAAGVSGETKTVTPSFTKNGNTYTAKIADTPNVEGVKIQFSGKVHNSVGFFQDDVINGFLISDASGNLKESADGVSWGTIQSDGSISITVPTIKRKIIPDDKYVISSASKYTSLAFSQVSYQKGAIDPAKYNKSYNKTVLANTIGKFQIYTLPGIAGEVLFKLGEVLIKSKDSELYLSNDTQIGTINKLKGVLEFNWQSNVNLTQTDLKADWIIIATNTTRGNAGIKSVVFKTAAPNLAPGSALLRYTTLNGTYAASANTSGNLIGTDITTSKVDVSNGIVRASFSTVIDPENIRYDAIAETTLPLDPELLGINPVRLPPNGKVPVFDAGRHLVIFHEQTTDISGTPAAGQTITLNRSKQSYMEVVDVNGARLAFDQYTANREEGKLIFANPLTLVDRNGDAMTGPYKVIDRIEDMALCTEAQVTGLLSLSSALTRDYPADETRVASALVWGDVGARYYNLFSQQVFKTWSDELDADPIIAKYDDVNYPIQIVNKDSFAGRWMIRFKTSSTVEVIEETLGVVLPSASIVSDHIAPVNPATGNPYWTMDFNGFGSGWVAGNIVRFNTDSGEENMWLIRSVQPGQLTETVDGIDVEIRGDAN